jgi:hypothetical protein
VRQVQNHREKVAAKAGNEQPVDLMEQIVLMVEADQTHYCHEPQRIHADEEDAQLPEPDLIGAKVEARRIIVVPACVVKPELDLCI